MSLRIVYGRSGTGKSQYCYNEIKENINSGRKKYIITPEQFSYSAEKKLLKNLEGQSAINAEVINFNRMAQRVFNEVGGANNLLISKSGKAMIINEILQKYKSNLKLLGNSNENVELLLKTISELKKHSITKDLLQETMESVDDKKLKIKLEDVLLIYNSYEEYIKNKFIDEEDVLTKLSKKIEESKIFDDTEVYIDEFSGFTFQEYEIITKILKTAKRLTITFCIDSLEKINIPETDIFNTNKEVLEKIIECAKNAKVNIEKPVFLTTNYKSKTEELKHLEKNIYEIKYEKYQNEVNNIKLFLAANPYSQIEYVAKQITKLVSKEGLKYNQIAIVTKNIDEISSITKAIFTKYEIPVFIDEKSQITNNILIKYVLSIIEIFSKNWSYESVISYIKSGFLDLDKNDIHLIENYASKWKINHNKWLKTWNMEDENLEKLENLRKTIVIPLIDLKAKISESKTARKITEEIYNFLEENLVQEKLESKIQLLEKLGKKELTNEYKSSLEILFNVFDEIVTFFGDENMTFDRYKEILKIGLSYKEFGQIPQFIDQVILGDTDRSKSNNIKVSFIIGLNDGVFPSINKDEGFLNDKDRETLKQMGAEIAKGTIEALYEDHFNIYKAFTLPEEKLYLVYLSSNKEGKSLRPSMLVNRVKKIFLKLQEESDVISKTTEISLPEPTFNDLLINIQNLKNGEEIEPIWYEVYKWFEKNEEDKLKSSLKGIDYTNKPEKINKENIKKLYGNILKTSVSRLEQYKKCPFSFHLKYGLKLKEKEEYKINAIDTGTFMHDVIDTFFRENQTNIKELEPEEVESKVENIINEKLNLKKNYIFTSSPKFIILTNKLKRAVIESVKYIVYQMQSSDFDILGNEVEFSRIIGNTEITGKIDRLDIAKNNEGQYLRIIDYKSSTKDINLNEMESGIQIQLLTYMDSILDAMEKKMQAKEPAGILYFNLIDPIISKNKNLSDEEIKEEIKKSFRMKGLVIADINIIKLMDKNITSGPSNNIPVYLNSKGSIIEKWSSVISKQDFTNLQKKIRKLVIQISDEILSGNIDIKPVYNKRTKTANCKYCPYKTICGFDSNINNYTYVQNKAKSDILESLKEE